MRRAAAQQRRATVKTYRSVTMRKMILALFGTLALAAPAAAQDYKPFDIAFGFGWAFPTTDLKNSFDAGWNGMIGGMFNLNQHWGIEADYTYAHMNGPDKQILVSSTPIAAAVTN